MDSTCSRNSGNCSNWVHWLYAVETGTPTSMVSMIWLMQFTVGRSSNRLGDTRLTRRCRGDLAAQGHHGLMGTDDSVAQEIDAIIAEAGGWRGATLARVRQVIT